LKFESCPDGMMAYGGGVVCQQFKFGIRHKGGPNREGWHLIEEMKKQMDSFSGNVHKYCAITLSVFGLTRPLLPMCVPLGGGEVAQILGLFWRP
jgi:hypothetical protein